MRRSLAIAAGILGMLVIVFVARAQTAPSDYAYIVDITVENATSTDYDGPIPVVMNTGNLSAGGFYNATGTDILFTDSSNDTIGGLPQGITSTTSTWWWGGSVPGDTTRTFRVFMGGLPAEASFPFHAGRTIVTVPDDSSIDYTTSTSIAVTAKWRNFPATGEAYFVRKPFSYEVGLNQTTLFARAYSAATTTDTLAPETDITVNHVLSSCTVDPPNAACAALDDGELLYTSTGQTRTDHYNMEDSSNLAPGDTQVLEIYSVDLVFEHRCNGGSTCTSEAFVRLPGFESSTGAIAVGGGAFQVRTTALPFAPDGSVWTLATFDDLTIGITSTATGGVGVETDYVWLSVQFLAASEHTWTDTALVANREYQVRAIFVQAGGSATWDLQIDTEPVDQASFTQGPILPNAIAMSFGRDLDGRMAGIDIGTLPGDLDLALDFTGLVEGQVGTSTNGFVWTGTVADTSAPALTATYVIVADNTFLTTTVFALQVVPPTAPAAAEITTVDSVGDPSLAILFETSTQSSDNPILGALFDACTTGGIPCDAWWLILTTFLVGVGGSVALSRFDSIPTVAAMSLAGFLVVALFGGYSPWVVAMTGLWFLGMVPLLQFANKS